MQIVIDIPDKTYHSIKNTKQVGERNCWILTNAIINSTPLPKGHGRLIDADELYKQDKEDWLTLNNAPFISTDYAHVFAEIDNAPTIIESDTESEG